MTLWLYNWLLRERQLLHPVAFRPVLRHSTDLIMKENNSKPLCLLTFILLKHFSFYDPIWLLGKINLTSIIQLVLKVAYSPFSLLLWKTHRNRRLILLITWLHAEGVFMMTSRQWSLQRAWDRWRECSLGRFATSVRYSTVNLLDRCVDRHRLLCRRVGYMSSYVASCLQTSDKLVSGSANWMLCFAYSISSGPLVRRL